MNKTTVRQDNDLHTNNCTRIFVVVSGVLIGLTGSIHGVAEALKGNNPTGGSLMAAIGAFTLIQNYLYTGIAAILAGLLVIAWTIAFIHKKNGPAFFMMLSILLFLTGGGVAIAFIFPVIWGLATRINKPLNWWRKMLPGKTRKTLSGLWIFSFISCFVSLLTAILIWIVLTPPGAAHVNPVYRYTCWSFLALALFFLIMTIITGFARDIENQPRLN